MISFKKLILSFCCVFFLSSTVEGKRNVLGCSDVTFDKCNDIDGVLGLIENISVENCRDLCIDVFENHCFTTHYNVDKKVCKILSQSIEDYIRSCRQLGGPNKPNVDDCLAETDPCEFYHDETCKYTGHNFNILENIETHTKCQSACSALTGQCAYFLYDFDTKDCKLYDDGARECDVKVGPATPSFEDCQAITTTTAPKTVYLVGGPSNKEGNVYAINPDTGVDGPVCHDQWDVNDANVVCRQLGFSRASQIFSSSKYGPVSDTFSYDHTLCAGNENLLSDCPYENLGPGHCKFNEGAGVLCE